MSFEPKVIDITEKQKVVYCIPEWLRESQIKESSSKPYKRFVPTQDLKRDKPIALVCFGPSLNQTWLGITEFEHRMTCSGGYKFLRDRGLEVNWHVEVDPRSHKTKLIGDNISPNTEFLIASCCHPDVFKHLENFHANITLWHTYSGESSQKIPTIFNRGEWVMTGGANVGLRALVLARLLGFTDIHIFGMDGSFPKPDDECKGLRHAASHPNVAKKYIVTKFNDKDFYTTPAFLECAKMTFHEISMLPDTKITFYGEGLIQEMAKHDKTPRRNKVQIAFCPLPTITQDYIAQNEQLHKLNAAYGISVLKHINTIKKVYDTTKSKSILDYGCGKGLLARELDFPIWEYDPAIEGKKASPRAADLVVCVDVLEHVEPNLLDMTLKDLVRVTKKIGYLVINTSPSSKVLPDGRNTHLIQKDMNWWQEKLSQYFTLVSNAITVVDGKELRIVVSPKVKSINEKKESTVKGGDKATIEFNIEKKEEVCV